MPFQPENKAAAKPEAERLRAQLIVRVHPVEKSAWVKAARPGKLADWVRDTLNDRAGLDPDDIPGRQPEPPAEPDQAS